MRTLAGDKKTATIDIDRATEFVGDDVDQFSSLVDLGGVFSRVQVWLPVLTSGVVSVFGQLTDAIDEVPKQVQAFDDDATGHFAHASTATEGSIVLIFEVGALQYLRVKAAGNQAADRSIPVRGC